MRDAKVDAPTNSAQHRRGAEERLTVTKFNDISPMCKYRLCEIRLYTTDVSRHCTEERKDRVISAFN